MAASPAWTGAAFRETGGGGGAERGGGGVEAERAADERSHRTRPGGSGGLGFPPGGGPGAGVKPDAPRSSPLPKARRHGSQPKLSDPPTLVGMKTAGRGSLPGPLLDDSLTSGGLEVLAAVA